MTPTPRPSCSPRPPVTVSTRPDSPGALQVTGGVTRSAAAPNNTIARLQFGVALNAIVEIGGPARPGGDFELPLPPGTQQVTFTVRRPPTAPPNLGTTVPFTVTDDCGGWQTFVVGGSTAF